MNTRMGSEQQALLEGLAGIVGTEHVITDAAGLEPYRRERRGLFDSHPLAVVRPADTGQVAAVVRACADRDVAIVPQGGNTGLVGGTSVVGDRAMLVVNLGRLNRIREVDPANFTLTAEAGCTLADVQAAASAADRLFPLSYAAEGSCQLGGNLATNAGGMNVLRYGNTRDLALGLEVVLPDGRVWEGLSALRKDNSGYDLRDLFIGAEGTLGLITAAVVKLFPRPRHSLTGLVALERAEDTVALLGRMHAASGESLTAFEFMSRTAVAITVAHDPVCEEPFDRHYAWYVVFDIATSREHDDLEGIIRPVLADARASGMIRDWQLGSGGAERERLWRIRNGIPGAQRGEGGSIKHDVSVPVSRVPEFLRRADAVVTERLPGIRPCAFGHVGDGNVHYNLTQPEGTDTAAYLRRWDEFSHLVHDVVREMGGSFAAEHGVGRLKPRELARLKSPVEVDLIRRVKQAFDPDDRINPGVLAPEPTDPPGS